MKSKCCILDTKMTMKGNTRVVVMENALIFGTSFHIGVFVTLFIIEQ